MRVLVTGACGLIGGILVAGLAGDHEVAGIDREAPRRGAIRRADLTGTRDLDRHFAGVEAVVDLAGFPSPDEPWERILANNVRVTVNVLEAARRAGVRRYVFASSNHVTGLYERDEPYASIVAGRIDAIDPTGFRRITRDDPIRPDSPYGVGKALGEAAARYVAETGGPAATCLRIGTVNAADRPANPRHFATLLRHADLVSLVRAALAAPDERRFGIHYGVSDNPWRIWDVEDARRELGWAPRESAEAFRGG